jgi:hypothetical protein
MAPKRRGKARVSVPSASVAPNVAKRSKKTMPQKVIPPLEAIIPESKRSVKATVDEATVTGADLTPRRDFVSKASRVMEDKLKHVPVHILDAAVGKKQKGSWKLEVGSWKLEVGSKNPFRPSSLGTQ